MANNNVLWASEIVEAAHIEADTEKAHNVDLAITNHLEAIILLFPLLPETCQRVIRVNVEALAALAV